ncbi:CueP family metal-binding protein [Paenibacillus zanthoxyli]|uniref:CueP family metal-binding protein n=1 Tax=Paenibacillus zanthoxyli TaxID=369399 RepID=UPI00046E5641|nr:CueP family metal-binding protein [Paenibacillus zanthoxyli]
MRQKIFIAAALIVVVLGAYLIAGGDKTKETAKQTAPNIKQLVNDYSSRKLDAKSASITSHELTVTADNNDKSTYSLPQNEFFVSIAPYVNKTHPCATHSLTGCQGEMANEKFNVTITDRDGKVVIKDVLQSFDNGFIDFWLPRDQTFHVTIEHGGKSSESEISTFEDDNTCISTIQLT